MATRITFFITMLLASVTIAFSQDNDPWVGTWEGVETIHGFDGDFQNKFIVRINKFGDDYGVRVKLIPLDNPSKVKYWNDCKVTYSDNSSIEWKSFIETNYDFDSTYKNGRKVYSADYTWVVSALYSNGRIVLEKFLHVDL